MHEVWLTIYPQQRRKILNEADDNPEYFLYFMLELKSIDVQGTGQKRQRRECRKKLSVFETQHFIDKYASCSPALDLLMPAWYGVLGSLSRTTFKLQPVEIL